MENCSNCTNREICGSKGISECEHYDKSFTRSEIINLLQNSDKSRQNVILKAIADKYRLKLAF